MQQNLLKAGQQAPDFTATDIHGNKISLEDYKGKKLMICFFRYAGCPFCSVTVLKLIDIYPSLAARGLHVIGFSQSKKENVIKYIEKFSPPFPVIADQKKVLYNLYKVPSTLLGWPRSVRYIPEVLETMVTKGTVQGEIDGDLNLIPASFLIGPPEFTIYQAYYGTTFLDVFEMDDIYEFLEKIEV